MFGEEMEFKVRYGFPLGYPFRKKKRNKKKKKREKVLALLGL